MPSPMSIGLPAYATTMANAFRMAEPAFLRLPTELHLLILSRLDFASKQLLGAVNRYFHSLIPTPTLSELLDFESDFSAHEIITCPSLLTRGGRTLVGPWELVWIGELVCFYCKRLRPRWEFADGYYYSFRNNERFCVDCGLSPKDKRKGYRPGVKFNISGQGFVWCKACKMFTSEVGPSSSGQCADCYTRTFDLKRLVSCLPRNRRRRNLGKGMYRKKADRFEMIEGEVGNMETEREYYDSDDYEDVEDTGYWQLLGRVDKLNDFEGI
jgi:hypothetical protein